MAIYIGAMRPAGWRLFWIPYCFTNNEKAAFWAAAVGGSALQGLLIGLGIGAVAEILGSPNGAVIGVIVGAGFGLWLAWNAACPVCGSCIEILFYQTFWPFSLIVPLVLVVPAVARPSTADCVMIPPGCP